MGLERLLAWLTLLAAAPAAGQAVSTSPGPEKVSVTVYRDPGRQAGQPLNPGWPSGYALITERRTVDIPAGDAEIRFEGVAGGIQPESAIVTGLPDGVIEKNQDSWLLSPGSLLDASLGRRVHIRRTSRASGEVTETEAVIRSGAGGAVVLETPSGIEALRCTGLPETLVYDRIPAGLSARPTLSVRVRSSAAARATITLSYLSAGFDWQADYIAEVSRDGSRIDLFAWLTLANGDPTGFVEADTQAVAGKLNREAAERRSAEAPPLNLECWPQGTTTSDLAEFQPPPPMAIMVTGSRVARANLESAVPVTSIGGEEFFQAGQEELGDLKLYRIPEPVTVAAKSQKQVALLRRTRIPVELAYRWYAAGEATHGLAPTFVTRNREEERLGLPLPAGRIDFYEIQGGRRVLVGRGALDDIAVGEPVELETGVSTDVVLTVVRERDGADWDEF
ncbi:DUF4139 domain-containing protein, partial [Allosphingosinicella sp.]|uniref:DUF4139 domain-containing protein n=1 Tax=Allosphingosinicella sp. TaxID=2823234 RepID=UPI002EFAA402